MLGGVKDIRDAVTVAQVAQGRRTILFVDEVHRFNKAQQDAFLPYVESGLFTFIGATTENPSFEVNSALLSRARVYVLQSLTPEDCNCWSTAPSRPSTTAWSRRRRASSRTRASSWRPGPTATRAG